MSSPDLRIATARAPACLPAARPVGIDVAGWLSAGILELEAPDASGAPDEVAPKPPLSTEVTSGGVAHPPAYLLDRVLDVPEVQSDVVGSRRQRLVSAPTLPPASSTLRSANPDGPTPTTSVLISNLLSNTCLNHIKDFLLPDDMKSSP